MEANSYCLLFSMALMLPVVCLSAGGSTAELHPLVLIPGSGGNQLEARLTADYKPSSLLCALAAPRQGAHTGGWFRLWFDPSVLVPAFTRCFAERMTLYYHADLDDYRNAPGVETRVPHFGSTQSLLYLDPHLKYAASPLPSISSSAAKRRPLSGISPNTWRPW